MIFRPELVKLIRQGKKTMTRRRVKYTKQGRAIPCIYKLNHAYAIQEGRGARGDGKITVTAEPHIERLGEISLADAKREGFRTTGEFFNYWQELYARTDEQMAMDLATVEVHVVSFLYGEHIDTDRFLARSAPSQTCQAMLPNGKRCKRAFSDDPEPQEVCRCGARRPPQRLDDIGYTSVASKGLKGELGGSSETREAGHGA